MSVVLLGLNYCCRYRLLVERGVYVYGGEESDRNGRYGPARGRGVIPV